MPSNPVAAAYSCLGGARASRAGFGALAETNFDLSDATRSLFQREISALYRLAASRRPLSEFTATQHRGNSATSSSSDMRSPKQLLRKMRTLFPPQNMLLPPP